MSPRRIAGRGKDRMQRRFHGAKDKVMGSADDGRHQVKERFEGNPLAAGLIAVGAGALVASLLPGDRASRELAERAEPMVDQAKDEVKQVGREMGENVGQSAKESAHHLEDQAKGSAEHVKDEAKGSAEHVKDESRHASENVRHETRRRM